MRVRGPFAANASNVGSQELEAREPVVANVVVVGECVMRANEKASRLNNCTHKSTSPRSHFLTGKVYTQSNLDCKH